jgi:hypothetical protein
MAPERFVFAFSYIAAGRLRRPNRRASNFVIFARFVFFVVKTDPLPPSSPPSPGAQHPADQPRDDEEQKDDQDRAADHVSRPF